MCGIAGFVNHASGRLDAATVKRVADLMCHRGPDDHGFYAWSPAAGGRAAAAETPVGPLEVGLVHRRLAIIDLSERGRQPMSTPDGRYTLVLNGEIYNYVELRRELELRGHTFQSTGDAAVLLAACAEWGVGALPRLVGMFAFALLDAAGRKLILARDPAGMKPLYYTSGRAGFAFASEIKPLLELPGVSRRADPQHLYDYLRSGLVDHGGGTMFSAIRQLPGAHYLVIDLDAPAAAEPVPYWVLGRERRTEPSFEGSAAALRSIFLDSVRLHLRADVPLGVALSGGIDSAAILAALRHLAGPDQEIHAFSYVAEDPALNEERWAVLAAQAAGAFVHKTAPTSDEFWADLDHLIEVQEQPFGSASVYAQYAVMRTARQNGIKVMLDGQGADELFAGYRPFVADRVRTLQLEGRRVQAARLASRARVAVANGASPTPPEGPGGRKPGLQRPWFNTGWFKERGVVMKPGPPGSGTLSDRLHDSFVRSSLPHLLRYEDRNSMAFSVESRLPFLAPAIVEFASSLPESFLIDSSGGSKAVLRSALRGLLPEEILERRDKLGFETPDRQWLIHRKDAVRTMLHGKTARRIPAIDAAEAKAEWAALVDGRAEYGRHVWRWVNLIRWAERFEVQF